MSKAKQGKPYCPLAARFLTNYDLRVQCRHCNNVIYVGCPGFEPKQIALAKISDYLKWLHDENES